MKSDPVIHINENTSASLPPTPLNLSWHDIRLLLETINIHNDPQLGRIAVTLFLAMTKDFIIDEEEAENLEWLIGTIIQIANETHPEFIPAILITAIDYYQSLIDNNLQSLIDNNLFDKMFKTLGKYQQALPPNKDSQTEWDVFLTEGDILTLLDYSNRLSPADSILAFALVKLAYKIYCFAVSNKISLLIAIVRRPLNLCHAGNAHLEEATDFFDITLTDFEAFRSTQQQVYAEDLKQMATILEEIADWIKNIPEQSLQKEVRNKILKKSLYEIVQVKTMIYRNENNLVNAINCIEARKKWCEALMALSPTNQEIHEIATCIRVTQPFISEISKKTADPNAQKTVKKFDLFFKDLYSLLEPILLEKVIEYVKRQQKILENSLLSVVNNDPRKIILSIKVTEKQISELLTKMPLLRENPEIQACMRFFEQERSFWQLRLPPFSTTAGEQWLVDPIPKDGNCGLTCIGATREGIADLLLANADNEEIRKRFAPTMTTVIPTMLNHECSVKWTELFEKKQLQGADLDVLLHQIFTECPGFTSEITGETRENRNQRLVNYLTEQSTEQAESFLMCYQALQNDVFETETQMSELTTNKDIFVAYTEMLRDNEHRIWIDIESMLFWTENQHIPLTIWCYNQNKQVLEISAHNGILGDGLNVLYADNHFDLLIKSPVITQTEVIMYYGKRNRNTFHQSPPPEKEESNEEKKAPENYDDSNGNLQCG